MKKIKLIVCCDAAYGIGVKNSLPWNVPEDMKIFRKKTIGDKNNCVIMGRNTCESIPSKYFPLSNRHNCILSSRYPQNENVSIYRNEEELFSWIETSSFEEYWIIGGKMIYDLFLQKDKVSEIHMSILEKKYNCDTFFDKSILNKFTEKESVLHEQSGFVHKIFVKYL